jgi:hypothetical protein
MSPVATRSLCIGVFVAVLGVCLAAVTPSLAGILLSRPGTPATPPPWLWQSRIYGGLTPTQPAAPPARPVVHHRRRPKRRRTPPAQPAPVQPAPRTGPPAVRRAQPLRVYDHATPPSAAPYGLGLRIPGIIISPYARRGLTDHQAQSFDSYLGFVEDDFLHGRRLDPRTDGRPDSRPLVGEDMSVLGDLRHDFDFTQKPRPALLLQPRPPWR